LKIKLDKYERCAYDFNQANINLMAITGETQMLEFVRFSGHEDSKQLESFADAISAGMRNKIDLRKTGWKMLLGSMTREEWAKEYPDEAAWVKENWEADESAKIESDIAYERSCKLPENQIYQVKRWR